MITTIPACLHLRNKKGIERGTEWFSSGSRISIGMSGIGIGKVAGFCAIGSPVSRVTRTKGMRSVKDMILIVDCGNKGTEWQKV